MHLQYVNCEKVYVKHGHINKRLPRATRSIVHVCAGLLHILCLQAASPCSLKCVKKTNVSYFSTKIYVVGTENNRLNETVLMSTKTYVKTDEQENIFNFKLKMCLSKLAFDYIVKPETSMSYPISAET